MKPPDEEKKLTEGRTKAARPRFKIEKLEERIAPARGGIPGAPDYTGGGGRGGGRFGRFCT